MHGTFVVFWFTDCKKNKKKRDNIKIMNKRKFQEIFDTKFN